jgi:hypothetical protein
LRLMGLPREAIKVQASRFGIPLPQAHPPAQYKRALPDKSRRHPPAGDRHHFQGGKPSAHFAQRRSPHPHGQASSAPGPERHKPFDRPRHSGFKPDGFPARQRRPDYDRSRRHPEAERSQLRPFSGTNPHTQPGRPTRDYRQNQGQAPTGQDRHRPHDRSQASPGFKPHAPNKRHWHPNDLNPQRGENRFEKNNFIYHGPAGNQPSQDRPSQGRPAQWDRKPGGFQKPHWKKGPKHSNSPRWHNPQR